MLTDDQINENAAALKKLLMMEAGADETIINIAVDTVTSFLLAFHRIARAGIFHP